MKRSVSVGDRHLHWAQVCCDYSLHMAVTHWGPQVEAEMAKVTSPEVGDVETFLVMLARFPKGIVHKLRRESKPGTTFCQFRWFLDLSDQNELYHIPSYPKIWDLSEGKKLWTIPLIGWILSKIPIKLCSFQVGINSFKVFMAYKDVFMLQWVLFSFSNTFHNRPLSQSFLLFKTVFRDGEIIECFKRAREVGAIAQVKLWWARFYQGIYERR